MRGQNFRNMKEKKTLQKFTEFEKVKTVEDFRELQKTDPKQLEKVCEWLKQKIYDAQKEDATPAYGEIDKYWNRLERYMEAMKYEDETVELFKRDRWYLNERLIKNYMHNTLVNKRYVPTNSDISNATGLSRVTVIDHVKGNSLSMFKVEQREQYKMLNSNALNQLYYLAFHNADVKALKMFIELTKDDSGTMVNNFIQINNTKIDTVLIEKLPAETRRQIETLILENLPE